VEARNAGAEDSACGDGGDCGAGGVCVGSLGQSLSMAGHLRFASDSVEVGLCKTGELVERSIMDGSFDRWPFILSGLKLLMIRSRALRGEDSVRALDLTSLARRGSSDNSIPTPSIGTA
jgi:hypothetical protein